MPYTSTKTRTWTISTANSGDYFDAEFNRIYENTNYLLSLIGETATTLADNATVDVSSADPFAMEIVDKSNASLHARVERSGSDVKITVDDPDLAVSFTLDTANSLNFYIVGAALRIQNKLGSTKTFGVKEVF